MVVNNINDRLTVAGLSEYEGKAYVALLKSNPATAYEVAKRSSVPSSKIYEVLARLQEKQIVSLSSDEYKKRYTPLDPEEFIARGKNRIENTFRDLHKDLLHVKENESVSTIWNIHEYLQFIEKAERIIANAKHTILVSGWHQELAILEAVLHKKEKRGVQISIVHFGEPSVWTGQVFQHPIEDTIYNEKGGRGLVIIADSEEALMGTVLEEQKVEGAWSKNHGFVTLAEDYIKHDIYIMKIVKRFDRLLLAHFGEKYHKLRDIFHDEEV
jgi:HTH-type transcriptional regulator, sugar sensing transcriptional regulator